MARIEDEMDIPKDEPEDAPETCGIMDKVTCIENNMVAEPQSAEDLVKEVTNYNGEEVCEKDDYEYPTGCCKALAKDTQPFNGFYVRDPGTGATKYDFAQLVCLIVGQLYWITKALYHFCNPTGSCALVEGFFTTPI